MRLVSEPLDYPPRACVVTNRADGRFVDFNVVIDRPEPTRVYMKDDIVEEAARMLGMVPASEVTELRERMVNLGTELTDLQETLKLAAELEERVAPERIAA